MKLISSRENSLYKELKHLASNSHARRRAGRTLLDGVHLCEAYLHQVGTPFLCLISESSLSHREVASLVEVCQKRKAQCITLVDTLYDGLSQVENGVGILFVVDVPQPAMPSDVRESAVILDNLQDPGNLGSILRSAAAAGIKNIFCSKGTVGAWSPKVLRSGMGAHFFLNIFENLDLSAFFRSLTIPILATSSYAQKRIYDVDLKQPIAWVFGHEGQGVSSELMEAATFQVSIPHHSSMESLNVAACAAICLFEQVRQKEP